MKTLVAKPSTRTTRKGSARKQETAALAICPVDTLGWCPYPYSLSELKRHLKLKSASTTDLRKPAKRRRPAVQAH